MRLRGIVQILQLQRGGSIDPPDIAGTRIQRRKTTASQQDSLVSRGSTVHFLALTCAGATITRLANARGTMRQESEDPLYPARQVFECVREMLEATSGIEPEYTDLQSAA